LTSTKSKSCFTKELKARAALNLLRFSFSLLLFYFYLAAAADADAATAAVAAAKHCSWIGSQASCGRRAVVILPLFSFLCPSLFFL
jgi:hypothetical protein